VPSIVTVAITSPVAAGPAGRPAVAGPGRRSQLIGVPSAASSTVKMSLSTAGSRAADRVAGVNAAFGAVVMASRAA